MNDNDFAYLILADGRYVMFYREYIGIFGAIYTRWVML